MENIEGLIECNGTESPSGRLHKARNRGAGQLRTWNGEEIPEESMMKYDSKAGDYECQACLKRFKKKGLLWTHFRSVHLRDRPHKCNLCPFAASQKINLETHIKSIHLRMRPFRCWMCPFAAAQLGNLQTHVRVAHVEKKQEIAKLNENEENAKEFGYKNGTFHVKSSKARGNHGAAPQKHKKR